MPTGISSCAERAWVADPGLPESARPPQAAAMTYKLSLLEKSLIPQGSTAAEALHRTTLLAQRAEALGYHRFWLIEHHVWWCCAAVVVSIVAGALLSMYRRLPSSR